jgi:uncharacterized protein YcfJ
LHQKSTHVTAASPLAGAMPAGRGYRGMIGHKLGEPGGNCTVTGSVGEGYIGHRRRVKVGF